MKLNLKLIVVVSLSLFLGGCSLPFAGKKAGIQVASNPQANVFLDEKPLGQTPVYQENVEAGSHTLKIVSSDTSLLPWESKVTLNKGIITIVDRQLANEENKAHGYILSFEKLTNKSSAEVNVLSIPDTVSIAIDNAPVGFSPFKSDAVTPGAHTFTLTSPGYQDKVIKASVQGGYRLIINAQLAALAVVPTPTPELSPSPIATPSPTPKTTKSSSSSAAAEITPLPKQATTSAIATPYVEILSTPTGWLKVRAEANVNSEEVAKVNPGDKFPYLDTKTSWYQIEYQKGKQGWISATYAKLVK